MSALGLAVLLAAAFGTVVVWTGVAWAFAAVLGEPVSVARLGFGPVIATRSIANAELRVGVIPLGGSLERSDELPFSAAVMIVPHLAVALPALWASAPWAALRWCAATLAFQVPAAGGPLEAFGAATRAAAAAPWWAAAAVAAMMGLWNAALGAGQSAARSLGERFSLVWTLVLPLWLLAALARGLWI